MAIWETVTETINNYTGLSPTAFFTILALTVVTYKIVSGMFVAADDYVAVKRANEFVLREPVQIGDVTEEELKAYDGSDPDKPLLMAIKGNVYDVSRSRLIHRQSPNLFFSLLFLPFLIIYTITLTISWNYYIRTRMFYGPGGPYALFAGRDASRALALMSFDPNDLTGNIEGLSDSELEALQEWEYKFMEKYVKVGQLASKETESKQGDNSQENTTE